MRRPLTALALFSAAVLCMPLAAAQGSDDARVILISIDGLMPAAYTDPALASYTPMPVRSSTGKVPAPWTMA